jgi:hypothetical protein
MNEGGRDAPLPKDLQHIDRERIQQFVPGVILVRKTSE